VRASATPFVLVPGGGHGTWCWEPLVEVLDRPAITVDLPGRGRRSDHAGPVRLRDFAHAVVADIDDAGLDDVVLVGHSMAGLTLPLVADRLGDRVRYAVFVSAIVARRGETMLDAVYGPRLGRAFAAAIRRGPERAAGPRWLARRNFCAGLPPQRRDWLIDHLVPEWTAPTVETVTAAWADRSRPPSAYVLCARDRQLRPQRQLVMAARLGPASRHAILDTGHDAMVSDPGALAAVLHTLAP
jgi:pimeloyl-ACP methyl ester carboxylesterase